MFSKTPVKDKSVGVDTELSNFIGNFAELVKEKKKQRVLCQLESVNFGGLIEDMNGLEVAIQQTGQGDGEMLGLILSHTNVGKLFVSLESDYVLILKRSIHTKSLDIFKKVFEGFEKNITVSLKRYHLLLDYAILHKQLHVTEYLFQNKQIQYSDAKFYLHFAKSESKLFDLLLKNKDKFEPQPGLGELLFLFSGKTSDDFLNSLQSLEVLFKHIPFGDVIADSDENIWHYTRILRLSIQFFSQDSSGLTNKIIKLLLDKKINFDKKPCFRAAAANSQGDKMFYLLLNYLSSDDLLEMLSGEESIMPSLLKRPTFPGVSMVIDTLLEEKGVELSTIKGFDELLKKKIEAGQVDDVEKLLKAGVRCDCEDILEKLVSDGKIKLLELLLGYFPDYSTQLVSLLKARVCSKSWGECDTLIKCLNPESLNSVVNAVAPEMIAENRIQLVKLLFNKIPSVFPPANWMSAALNLPRGYYGAKGDCPEMMFLLLRQRERIKGSPDCSDLTLGFFDKRFFKAALTEYTRKKKLAPSEMRCYKAAKHFLYSPTSMGYGLTELITDDKHRKFYNDLSDIVGENQFITLADFRKSVETYFNDFRERGYNFFDEFIKSDFALNICQLADIEKIKNMHNIWDLNRFAQWIKNQELICEEKNDGSKPDYNAMLIYALKKGNLELAVFLLSTRCHNLRFENHIGQPLNESNLGSNCLYGAVRHQNIDMFDLLRLRTDVRKYLQEPDNYQALSAYVDKVNFPYARKILDKMKNPQTESAAAPSQVSLASGSTMFGQSSSSSSSLEVKGEPPVTVHVPRRGSCQE